MTELVVVREYAKLTTCPVLQPTLDRASVSKSAFEYLCRLAGQFRADGAQLLEIEGSQWLRLDNFVGILETPCGTTIEILPKHVEAGASPEAARALMTRMIQAALDLPTRQVGPADLALFNAPLSEWVRRQFLTALEHLLKRGMKFDYLRIEDEQRHLRGQLDVIRQLRQPPHRAHYFHTRHDVFSLDSPENRLIRSALLRVAQSTQDPLNWRVSHELLQVLAEVPPSRDLISDFKAWRGGRLMAHYGHILPWCQLVLGQQMPLAVQGTWHGMSLLFPMEKLFERFVEATLLRQLPNTASLKRQSREAHLCNHDGRGFFQLRPDLVLEYAGQRVVLDAKWKRLTASRDHRYGISQSDFYQLFAYGHKYIDAGQQLKELVLIYPGTAAFNAPLLPFSFGGGMTLWVVPFELGDRTGDERLILPTEMTMAQAVKFDPLP
ncbi:McrC family protein [Massilia soli]|uniref:McrC family protein n=1 Tax=Massilia soli TaxID=2792854 RepID=A0ABS7SM39_9BURK|nr:McrC family protein [Massilia soli]MBZ2207194.1 McrC family protein [Massilia soli]